MSADASGRLSFRTVYGGPGIPGETVFALKRLQTELAAEDWGYGYDLFVTVGGDLTVIAAPTALRRPRVMIGARTVSGELRISSDDAMRAADPEPLLRSAVLDALEALAGRVAARDPAFDAPTDRVRIAALREGAGS